MRVGPVGRPGALGSIHHMRDMVVLQSARHQQAAVPMVHRIPRMAKSAQSGGDRLARASRARGILLLTCSRCFDRDSARVDDE